MEKRLQYSENTKVEDIHLYEFMLQAWTLLSCCAELRQKKYRAEYGNLRDLADSLSEYIESAQMNRCNELLDRIDLSRYNNGERLQARELLSTADAHTYVEVYYRQGVLLNRLRMYVDLERYWPFDDLNKRLWEEKMRAKLEEKILAESQDGTLIAAMIPGIEEKRLFPKLERISADADSLQTNVELYRVNH